MIIKVDEDLPRNAALLLCNHGYDALTVLDQEMGGWKDADLWKSIQREQRFLVTADKVILNRWGNARRIPSFQDKCVTKYNFVTRSTRTQTSFYLALADPSLSPT
jgi:hypothetical protein